MDLKEASTSLSDMSSCVEEGEKEEGGGGGEEEDKEEGEGGMKGEKEKK